jgi:acetyl esterase/lipase
MPQRLFFPFGVAVLAALAVAVVSGQDKSTYYTVRHPEQFDIDWKAFYDRAEALTATTRAEVPHALDLAYGSDAKQRLDVYTPKNAAAAAVFIFLHGGGFREGDRAQYGYVARPFARHGIVTVVASYRLLPHVYPDQVADTKAVLAWVFHHIAEHGGDPARVYIGGHSAGAILSAFVSVNRAWLAASSLPADFIKGFVPMSGPYDLRDAKGFVADFLPDPSRREEASPALMIRGTPPPCVISFGSTETPFLATSRDFAARLTAAGGRADVIVLEGMRHDQTALAAADETGPLFTAVLRMMTAGRSTQKGRFK